MRWPSRGLRPSFARLVTLIIGTALSRSLRARLRAAIKCLHIPQGPSLRFGLSCPDPSSLNRPHPSRSQAHRDFAAWRCLRCAGAPRRPASGSELSLRVLSCHAVPCDPEESDHRQFQISDVDVAFAVSRAARHSQKSAIRFTREVIFEATWFTQSLRPARLLAPLYGSDRFKSAHGGFYFQAFNRSVSLPAAGYNYNSVWTPSVGGTFTRKNGS